MTAPAGGGPPPRRKGGAGADDGNRTRDIQLGKLTLYQLSYVRSFVHQPVEKVIAVKAALFQQPIVLLIWK